MLPTVKVFMAIDILIVTGIVVWLLFGWSTEYSDHQIARYYRTWGVATRVAIDVDFDGQF